MRNTIWVLLVMSVLAVLAKAHAQTTAAPAAPAESAKVHYRAGKEIDFESLLIQGQLKRPEFSVVTGNADQGGDGVLRLRENFLDTMSADQGEEIRQ